MDLVYPRCAGLDVHAQSVSACVRVVADREVRYAHRTFGTSTRQLLALADWLRSAAVTHVALEATGVYWKPVWHVLEDSVTLVLANAAHVRQIAGRKTDRLDAQWLADLLAHGLVHSSFVPPPAIQDLRDLTRTRKQLVQEVSRHTLRLQKILEDANLKLTEVISDVLGVSGRAILHALIAGDTDPDRLADLTQGRLKADRATLVEALHGRVTAHHRFMLEVILAQIDATQATIARIEAEVETALHPFRAAVAHLVTMPGVSHTVASVLIAEIGVDMTRFPTAGHLVSWAGLCPRLHESAGKRRATGLRPATPWLKTSLVQAACAAVHTKGTYLQAQFLRLKSRRGPKKATIAVAASMLTAAYHMLRDDVDYKDLGGRYFEATQKQQIVTKLLHRLHGLGVEVTIKAA